MAPLDEHVPLVRLIIAGQDLDQCGLARPVVAEQRQDFVGIELEVDAIEGGNGSKA